MLKLKVIACDVFKREISYLVSRSPCFVDVSYLSQGLHTTPDILRARLKEEIQSANGEFPYNHFGLSPSYDYIVLLYGLCENSIVGLQSERVPLVAPRAHDCITLLLGSRTRYDELFHGHPGIYWYSRGWIECSLQPGRERYEYTYKEYRDKYGEDNAEYLMEMEQSWFKNYNRAVFIDWNCLGNAEYYRNYTRTCVEYLHWEFEETKGDPSLLKTIHNGTFEENEVLIIPPPPGKTIAPSYTEGIIKSV
jgi:hypothetical protein